MTSVEVLGVDEFDIGAEDEPLGLVVWAVPGIAVDNQPGSAVRIQRGGDEIFHRDLLLPPIGVVGFRRVSAIVFEVALRTRLDGVDWLSDFDDGVAVEPDDVSIIHRVAHVFAVDDRVDHQCVVVGDARIQHLAVFLDVRVDVVTLDDVDAVKLVRGRGNGVGGTRVEVDVDVAFIEHRENRDQAHRYPERPAHCR